MSTFCSIQTISLLFLQLILEVIENGSKTCRVSKLVFSFCLTSDTGCCSLMSAQPWPCGTSGSEEPPLPCHPPRLCQGQHPSAAGAGWSCAQTPWGAPFPSSLLPTSWAPPPVPAPSLARRRNDSCTFPPLAWAAAGQVRQTFCWVHLIHSAPLRRRACRVCSNAGF